MILFAAVFICCPNQKFFNPTCLQAGVTVAVYWLNYCPSIHLSWSHFSASLPFSLQEYKTHHLQQSGKA